jgi:hypothetical protein
MIFIIQFILWSHNNYHVMRLPSIKKFWPSQQMGLPFAVVSQVYFNHKRTNERVGVYYSLRAACGTWKKTTGVYSLYLYKFILSKLGFK